MLAGEYYEKDGAITVPVSIRGLYKVSLGDNLRLYGGAGSGLIYTKEESDTELIDGSASKVLLTAVAGMNLKMLGAISIFRRSHPRPGCSGGNGEQIRRQGRHLPDVQGLRNAIRPGATPPLQETKRDGSQAKRHHGQESGSRTSNSIPTASNRPIDRLFRKYK